MVEIILACTKEFGIGIKGGLPWISPEELNIFKKKTWDNVVIMGRKTIVNLPKLENRILICVSKKVNAPKARTNENNFLIFPKILTAIKHAKHTYPEKKIFIAGGAEIFNQFLNEYKYRKLITKLNISIFNNTYKCDTFIKFPFGNWSILTSEKYGEFTHYEMIYNEYGEFQYLNLLQETYSNGNVKKGRNGVTYSQFSKNLTFKLSKGFPLLTGKKMFFRGIVEELLFFLRGETDTTILENKGINIWKKNTEQSFLKSRDLKYKDGLMGPMYGYQLRFFNQPYNSLTGEPITQGQIDQLKNVIELIVKDPSSRRILMTTYNPAQVEEGVLYPCHSLMIQFYVKFNKLTNKPEKLNMYCFNRSSDLFLGLPFNIASSALLLNIIAKCTGLKPNYMHLSLGDAHVYSEHRDAVAIYLDNVPHFAFPKLSILKEISNVQDIENLKYEDFKLENYQSYPAIQAIMLA
jgi:thymidylate synthase/dihydrofolate reductase